MDRSADPDREQRHAQLLILGGVAVWMVLALAVQLRYGMLTSIVLVGWGGSILVCLAIGLSRSGGLRRDEPPAPADVGEVVIDLRDHAGTRAGTGVRAPIGVPIAQ